MFFQRVDQLVSSVHGVVVLVVEEVVELVVVDGVVVVLVVPVVVGVVVVSRALLSSYSVIGANRKL